jgi:hypothetical protein
MFLDGTILDRLIHAVEPADPFDGLGDFEVEPESFELMQARVAERMWRERALAAEMTTRQVEAVLSRPLKKYSKADLLRLIGIAVDAAGALDRRLFREGITE